MKAEDRYDRVTELFDQVCDLPRDRRAEFLAEACGDDHELIREVESLLDNDVPEWENKAAAEAGHGMRALVTGLTPPDVAPVQVGRFRVIRPIGKGGMGVVYEAEQDHPRRTVALKVLPPGALSAQHLKRFDREVDVLGRLHHPGIAQVYEAGVAETTSATGHSIQQPYFAMELIRGAPLDEHAHQHDLDQRDRLELMAKICDAVQHAHDHGVIHRDLKPGNILVEPDGRPKVLDFGVSRATNADVYTVSLRTEVGQLIGTIPYMSPEQVAGDPDALDARSDVYSLGVVLYELLAGRLPYDIKGRPIPEAIRIIQEQDPSRLSSVSRSLRGDIDTIVGRALEKEKERRYQSAAELAADIRRHLAHLPLVARPASTLYQLRKFARRNKALVGGALATMLAIVAGASFAVYYAIDAGRSARAALDREASALWASYRTSIVAAMSAFDAGRPQDAETHLRAAPVHLRGWEWRHLWARLDPVLASHELEPGAARDYVFPARRCAFLPDDTAVVAVAKPARIEVIDIITQDVVHTIDVTGASRPTLSSDGQRLAALVANADEVRIWSVANGRQQARIRATGDGVRLMFSDDGARLVIADDRRIRVIDEHGTLVATFSLADTVALDVSHDGEWLTAIHGETARLALCAVASGRIVTDAPSFNDATATIALHPHGDSVALGTGGASRFVRILDAKSLVEERRISPNTGHTIGLGWTRDGDHLAVVTAEGTIVLCDASSGRTTATMLVDDLTAQVPGSSAGPLSRSITLNPSATRMLVASADDVQLVDARPTLRHRLRGHRSFVYLVTFNAAGDTVCSVDMTGAIRLWDAHSGVHLGGLPVPWFMHTQPLTAGFTADGLGLIAGLRTWHADGVWGPLIESPADLEKCQDGSFRGVHLPPETQFRNIDALASPDGTWLARGDKIVVPTSQEQLASCGVFGKDLSPDGARLIAGQHHGFDVIDTKTLERVVVLRGHDSYIHDVAFSPDGTQVASGSGDYTVQLWDSLPRRERAALARRDELQRAALRPRIEGLLATLDPAAALARFVEEDQPNPDELRAAQRLLLLYGLANAQPPALHDLPDIGDFVVSYDARARAAKRASLNPATDNDWFFTRQSPAISAGRSDVSDPPSWRIRRTGAKKESRGLYVCSLTDRVVIETDRRGWRLQARFRIPAGNAGAFEFGLQESEQVWSIAVERDDDGSLLIHQAGNGHSSSHPTDGEFHEIEITCSGANGSALLLFDGAETARIEPEPATNDPLESSKSFVGSELTPSVFFGLRGGLASGYVDVQSVRFDIAAPGRPASTP